jgi:hypothetical protein
VTRNPRPQLTRLCLSRRYIGLKMCLQQEHPELLWPPSQGSGVGHILSLLFGPLTVYTLILRQLADPCHESSSGSRGVEQPFTARTTPMCSRCRTNHHLSMKIENRDYVVDSGRRREKINGGSIYRSCRTRLCGPWYQPCCRCGELVSKLMFLAKRRQAQQCSKTTFRTPVNGISRNREKS